MSSSTVPAGRPGSPDLRSTRPGRQGPRRFPVNGQYTLDVWASYVGFLPANHPKFTMIVVMRKPHVPGSDRDWTLNDGYFTAAPVWQKIAQAMVVDWRITPD